MRVLVTGASGFIGKHLVRALVQRSDDVRCLVRARSNVEGIQSLGIELVYGDVTDPDSLAGAVRKVELVIHLAGLTAAFRTSDLMQVNGQGTQWLAEACAAQPSPPRLVAVSSLAAAGPSSGDSFRLESDQAAPISNYGRSKRAAEVALQELADSLAITVIRPGIVFGPEDLMTLPMFSTIEHFGIHVVCGFRAPRISLLHVDDLVELVLLGAEHGEQLPTSDSASNNGRGYYFACGDEYPTYEQLGRIIAQALGRRAKVLRIPQPLPWLAAGVNELVARVRGRPDGLNIDKIREASVTSWACSGEKARRDLGFSITKPLSERMQETVNWYRQQGWM